VRSPQWLGDEVEGLEGSGPSTLARASDDPERSWVIDSKILVPVLSKSRNPVLLNSDVSQRFHISQELSWRDKRSGSGKRKDWGGGKGREGLSESRSVREAMVYIQDCMVFGNYLIPTWCGSPCG
jgi:hypothetical protein